MSRILFTADQHLFHKGAILLAKRPFDTIEKMNRHMIECWNAVVRPDDDVYHLGDISFGRAGETVGILKELYGTIYLIPGNHDRWLDDYDNELAGHLNFLPALTKLKFNHTSIWLSHYPLRCWEGSFKGAMHLYGHTHGTIETERLPRSMDIGVDSVGYYPLYIGDVWAKLDKEPAIPEEARIRDEEDAKLLTKDWKLWEKRWRADEQI